MWCEELTHLKRPWCWERLRAGGEGDNRGWDGWMASPTQWTWVWVDSGSWWWTGRPGVLWFMGSQRVRHDWATELNWTESEAINMSANLEILETSAVGIREKRSSFILISNKGNPKVCSNYHTIELISYPSKIIFKILHARIQQYMISELPDVQAGFPRSRGTRDQIASIL